MALELNLPRLYAVVCVVPLELMAVDAAQYHSTIVRELVLHNEVMRAACAVGLPPAGCPREPTCDGTYGPRAGEARASHAVPAVPRLARAVAHAGKAPLGVRGPWVYTREYRRCSRQYQYRPLSPFQACSAVGPLGAGSYERLPSSAYLLAEP